jgi:hypothetical protein
MSIIKLTFEKPIEVYMTKEHTHTHTHTRAYNYISVPHQLEEVRQGTDGRTAWQPIQESCLQGVQVK